MSNYIHGGDYNYYPTGTQRASLGAALHRVGFGEVADSDAVFQYNDGN